MSSAHKYLHMFLWLLVVASLWGVFRYAYESYERIQYPYMVNLGEPPLAQAIHEFHEGRIPYRKLDEPPYSLVPYGPVYVGLTSMGLYLNDKPFVAGRVIAFLGTLLAVVIVGLLAYELTRNRLSAAFSSILFLSHPYVSRWGVQVNVDMFGVALSAFALYCLIRSVNLNRTQSAAADQVRPVWLLAGGILTVLAFFTKSSCVSGAAAFFIVMLIRKNYKLALIFFAATASSALIIYGILNLITQGQYYFHTTYEISKRLYFWQFLYRFWWDAAKTVPLWVVGSLVFMGITLWRRTWGYAFVYLCFSILMTFSLGKQGSDTNYMLPWCAASSVALALMLHQSLKQPKIWFAVVVSIVLTAHAGVWASPLVRPITASKDSYVERKIFYDKLSKFIQATPGKILSEDMGLLLANKRKIYYEPFPMGQMSYSGVWDDSPILEELDRKEYSLAILYFYAPVLKANRTFTRAFMKKFNENYQFVGRVIKPWSKEKASLFFYVPKKK